MLFGSSFVLLIDLVLKEGKKNSLRFLFGVSLCLALPQDEAF